MQADIYIHAAPTAVYAKFSNIDNWSAWYPGVVAARWVAGEPWQDNARFVTTVRNVLGLQSRAEAVVRMSSPGRLLVYENSMSGLQIVASVSFEEDVGGCKLSIRKRFYGPLAFLMTLLGARQQRLLETGLSNLKVQIEGLPRR
ncbi:MAG: SRPBCC family protein [Caldilineaceae bacterium]